ncbi:MAG: FKBP-type peptidyl-prolyl cis-trans isomerase N-terminal domain-containing protein [Rikenellaceae bacterium]
MKKSLLIIGASALMLGTSCGVKSQAPSSVKDTAAYSAGIIISTNIATQLKDSSFNVNVAAQAVNDVFSGKSNDAQTYAIAAQIALSALSEIDSTMNPSVIIAGIEDFVAKKNTLQAQQAGQYIMNYINNKGFAEVETMIAEGEAKLAEADKIEGVKKSETGLRYLIVSEGEGDKVDDSVVPTVKYSLYDYDNNVLDSGTFAVTTVIAGFQEGIELLGKGGKATIWMPHDLGYGPMGQGTVKPYQALKFDIEIVDVTKK